MATLQKFDFGKSKENLDKNNSEIVDKVDLAINDVEAVDIDKEELEKVI